MLIESQLYTLIDDEKKFALYFLEGQKLIQDLVMTHKLSPGGFSYFRSSILSIQLMLGLLKQGEYFCFYIDSESPYFRLKIEMNALGLMRGVLYPNDLQSSPDTVTGKVRLIKFLPHAEKPYQSVIELQDVRLNEIMNLVLAGSYQVNSCVQISQDSDQGFMLHQLPLGNHEEPADLKETFNHYRKPMDSLMSMGIADKNTLCQEFAKLGFKYLANKIVRFGCGCSKEQMIRNVSTWAQHHHEEIFRPGENSVEVTCEYCKTVYQITKSDMQEFSPQLN